MKKNKLTTAVIAGLAGVAGVASVGNAVHINPDGTGQVLLYPYYSVNNGLDTTYSVVNTTDETKAVKVRFLESAHSREVLDFNVYMSPYDVWVGALTGKDSTFSGHTGEASGMHIKADNSCAPFLKDDEEFRPFEIDNDVAVSPTGAVVDYTDMQRGRVGHIEVLEMGVVNATAANNYPAAALHDSTGVPADCSVFETSWKAGGEWKSTDASAGITPPTGGLFGGASIVDVANGFNVSYDATALADWSSDQAQHTSPGSLKPGVGDTTPAISNVFDALAGTIVTDSWLTGAEAVSAVLMRDELYNEYVYDVGVEGKSSWVVNFPTKFYHVNSSPAIQPFTSSWEPNFAAGVFAACEQYFLTVYDREEQTYIITDDPGISPPQPGENPNDTFFCYETNNLEFVAESGSPEDSDLLGANYLQTYSDKIGGTPSGWAQMDFPNSMTAPLSGNIYNGLPVAGFMAQQLVNNAASAGVMAQYGGLFNHKSNVNISAQ